MCKIIKRWQEEIKRLEELNITEQEELPAKVKYSSLYARVSSFPFWYHSADLERRARPWCGNRAMLQKALVVAYYKKNNRVMDTLCRWQLEVLGREHSRVVKTLEEKRGAGDG